MTSGPEEREREEVLPVKYFITLCGLPATAPVLALAGIVAVSWLAVLLAVLGRRWDAAVGAAALLVAAFCQLSKAVCPGAGVPGGVLWQAAQVQQLLGAVRMLEGVRLALD